MVVGKRVLVGVASKHGATTEIAEAIAEGLAERGVDVTVQAAGEVEDVAAYDAVVLGSAVYVGRWLREARALVEREREALAGRPVWLFSSGPVGITFRAIEVAVDVSELFAVVQPIEHRVFSGKIDLAALSNEERAVVVSLRGPEGDYREWDAIRGWADAIARTLASLDVPTGDSARGDGRGL